MRKIILASHGSLAEGVYSAIRMILGDCENITCYSLDHYETPQDILQAVTAAIDSDPDSDHIILCDIKGGSVHNQLVTLCTAERPNVRLVSGVNLNLALELAVGDESMELSEVLSEAMAVAKDNIQYFDAGVLREELAKDVEGNLW